MIYWYRVPRCSTEACRQCLQSAINPQHRQLDRPRRAARTPKPTPTRCSPRCASTGERSPPPTICWCVHRQHQDRGAAGAAAGCSGPRNPPERAPVTRPTPRPSPCAAAGRRRAAARACRSQARPTARPGAAARVGRARPRRPLLAPCLLLTVRCHPQLRPTGRPRNRPLPPRTAKAGAHCDGGNAAGLGGVLHGGRQAPAAQQPARRRGRPAGLVRSWRPRRAAAGLPMLAIQGTTQQLLGHAAAPARRGLLFPCPAPAPRQRAHPTAPSPQPHAPRPQVLLLSWPPDAARHLHRGAWEEGAGWEASRTSAACHRRGRATRPTGTPKPHRKTERAPGRLAGDVKLVQPQAVQTQLLSPRLRVLFISAIP